MNRRDFLKVSIGSAIGLVLADKIEKGYQTSPYILWGDGIHDDTEAFQALMNGHTVLRPNGSELKMQELDGRDIVYFPTGTYNIKSAMPDAHWPSKS